MSTTIILNQSNDNYVSTTSPSSNYDSASSLIMSTASRDSTTRKNTALFQFQTPSILKYKKILTAYINFTYNYSVGISYDPAVAYLFELYIASLSAGVPITGITQNTLSNYGTYSSTIVTQTDSMYISGSGASKSLSVDITDLFKNNIHNNYFTAAITCWSQLTGAKSIASKEASSNVSLVILYDDIAPQADTPIYPIDVYLNQSDPITFRWKFNSESQVTQASFILMWKKKSDSVYTTLATGGVDLKYTAQANAFPTGEIDWSVTSTDILGGVTPTAYGSFTIVGKPSAPIITNVKNDALTKITWNSTDQSARELQLIKDGIVIDSDSSSIPDTNYSPNMFLENGTYEFRIKVMNNYGYWSDWTSYIFTLSATKPSTPSLTYLVDNNNVVLEVTNGTGRVFIYRIENDLSTPIAEITDNRYTDKTMKFNTNCKYFVRSYSNGIADSDIVNVNVSVDGFVLSTNDDTLYIEESDEQFIPLNETIQWENTLTYYNGRELPVLNVGEHLSHSISRNFIVYKDDNEVFKRILKSKSPILYRDNIGNKMFCSISGHSSSEKEILNGNSITLTFTEVYFDEAVIVNG